MIVFDIGNSTITFSVWVEKKWKNIVHIPSSTRIDKEQFTTTLTSYISTVKARHLSTAVLCSVVPKLTPVVHTLIQNSVQCKTLLLHTHSRSPLSAPPPAEMGQDLFANAVSGYVKSNGISRDTPTHSTPSYASITVDLGTALTFTAVTSTGTVAGVAIAPGINTSYQSLVANTAQLPTLPLKIPKVALGHTTATALHSGILLGYSHLIKGMVLQIKEELNSPCKVYATGGLNTIIKTLFAPPHDTVFDEIDPYHTLHGIRILGEYNMEHA